MNRNCGHCDRRQQTINQLTKQQETLIQTLRVFLDKSKLTRQELNQLKEIKDSKLNDVIDKYLDANKTANNLSELSKTSEWLQVERRKLQRELNIIKEIMHIHTWTYQQCISYYACLTKSQEQQKQLVQFLKMYIDHLNVLEHHRIIYSAVMIAISSDKISQITDIINQQELNQLYEQEKLNLNKLITSKKRYENVDIMPDVDMALKERNQLVKFVNAWDTGTLQQYSNKEKFFQNPATKKSVQRIISKYHNKPLTQIADLVKLITSKIENISLENIEHIQVTLSNNSSNVATYIERLWPVVREGLLAQKLLLAVERDRPKIDIQAIINHSCFKKCSRITSWATIFKQISDEKLLRKYYVNTLRRRNMNDSHQDQSLSLEWRVNLELKDKWLHELNIYEQKILTSVLIFIQKHGLGSHSLQKTFSFSYLPFALENIMKSYDKLVQFINDTDRYKSNGNCQGERLQQDKAEQKQFKVKKQENEIQENYKVQIQDLMTNLGVQRDINGNLTQQIAQLKKKNNDLKETKTKLTAKGDDLEITKMRLQIDNIKSDKSLLQVQLANTRQVVDANKKIIQQQNLEHLADLAARKKELEQFQRKQIDLKHFSDSLSLEFGNVQRILNFYSEFYHSKFHQRDNYFREAQPEEIFAQISFIINQKCRNLLQPEQYKQISVGTECVSKQEMQQQTEIVSLQMEIQVQIPMQDNHVKPLVSDYGQQTDIQDKLMKVQEQRIENSSELSQLLEITKQRLEQLRNHSFFSGQLFTANRLHMKQRLIMMIESYTNREIISTKLLLKHDPRNKTNFHEYIDDQENFILVALTINDKMIGGFSSGALSKKTICYQPSFLFSIGSQSHEIFKLKENHNSPPRSLTYDPYYIMFGNSDFRLKGTEMIGFSNLGMVSSSFESNGSPIEAFLGGDQKIREIPITYYEIFQTQFK